jgi:FkbH-like protein
MHAQDEQHLALQPSGLNAPIKLVIWDLDETLWAGTLSEGAVMLDPLRAELVRELNRRGIMSSICSKNDHSAAQARLVAEELWDEFVFPSISWSPKGQQIAQIIDDMQLRPENTLFIDDNIGNLEEARYYVSGIQTAGPEIVTTLLSLKQLEGKNDHALSRLRQYRLLERKVADRASTTSSNEDFLRSCDIRVRLGASCAEEVDRLVELMNRTNQLNYTKRRLTRAEFCSMLDDSERDTRYVHVRDRYGDYGICGLYSVIGDELTDFVFSCRILHMGVEQWLYQYLAFPSLTIAGEVSTPLTTASSVDWIRFDTEDEASSLSRTVDTTTSGVDTTNSGNPASRVLLKGGCDLWVVHDFLHGAITDEFTYLSPSGADVRGDHTEILRRSTQPTLDEFGAIIDRLPFLDRQAYASQLALHPDAFGTIIYSVLMDYTQGLYKLNGTSFLVPFGQHDEDITDPVYWPYLESQWSTVGIDRAFLEWFAEHFQYQGGLLPDAFQENIRRLRALLPASTRLILINGAEVAFAHPREHGRHLHHRQMNAALDVVVGSLSNTMVCDVRGLVTSTSDLTTNIRHYQRRTSMAIAEVLTQQVQTDINLETRAPVVHFRKLQRKVRRKIARTGKAVERF